MPRAAGGTRMQAVAGNRNNRPVKPGWRTAGTPGAVARLDEIATTMPGFPGKMGMSDAKVWDGYQTGEIGGIRDYCETILLDTCLVCQRFELIRGRLTPADHARECQLVREELQKADKPHLREFLDAWQAA